MNKRTWTILVYMAADNSLGKFARANLRQMLRAAINDEAHVVAQADLPRAKTRRYYFSRPGSLDEQVVDAFDNIAAGSPSQLRKFLTWGITNYSADNYAIVLWGHGTGLDNVVFWNGPAVQAKKAAAVALAGQHKSIPAHRELRVDGPEIARLELVRTANMRSREMLHLARPYGANTSIPAGAATTPIAGPPRTFRLPTLLPELFTDDYGNKGLSTHHLREVLEAAQKQSGGRIAVLGFDACLMNMVELAYEFRFIPLMVASETDIPRQSWPYGRILQRLKANPTLTPLSFAEMLVKQFAGFYRERQYATSLSGCDLHTIDSLVKAVDRLAEKLIVAAQDQDSRALISEARRAAQQFDVPDYVDLYDFCRLLKNKNVAAALQDACSTVMGAIGKSVMIVRNTGERYGRAKGLSIYFPTWLLAPHVRGANREIRKVERAVETRYDDLQFAQKTKWDGFLVHAMQITESELAFTA